MPRFTHNGADLYYELDGSGPPAVYAVGYSDHSNSVMNVILRQTLSQHFRLLTVDNRGAGQTTVSDGATFTIDDMADDIAALLDHHQMAPAHLLGISMGGCIAMTLALRHPQKVRSMVAAVSMAHIASGRSEFMLTTGREMIDRNVPRDIINRFTAIIVLGDIAFQDQAFVQAWIDAPPDPFEQTPTGARQQLEAVGSYDIRDRLGHIHTPTLVLSSPDDVLVPPQYQDEIAQNIPGAQIKRYPGGHVFMALPTHFPQFVEDTTTFWKSHSD